MDTLAIIQARMNSRRLPGKMMLALAGEPVLKLVIDRVRQAETVQQIVVATTLQKQDDVLVDLATSLGASVFRGEESNVFRRFYDCMQHHQKFEFMVRVCADNPLICPEIIDFIVKDHQKQSADYSCIVPEKGWPDGVGCEVVNRKTLIHLASIALSEAEREHCLLYVTNHASLFKINEPRPFDASENNSDIKIDIDTPEDYERLCQLLQDVNYKEVVVWDMDSIVKRYRLRFSR